MPDAEAPFTLSQQLQITPPAAERACPIPEQDLCILRNRIGRIQTGSLLFHTAGSILLGVAGSAFVATLTLPKPSDKIESFTVSVTCWAIFGVFLLSGCMALCFAKLQRKERETTKTEVLEEFDRLEARYLRPLAPADSSAASPSLERFLLTNTFTLVFKPPDGKKVIQFTEGGAILEGQNENENSWRIVDGKLELLTEKATVFSRFYFDASASRFDNPVDSDTLCPQPQYMIPCRIEDIR
jgi:hypothetical protein